MNERLPSQDPWEKPHNAPDHPCWNPEYRRKTQDYFAKVQEWVDGLYILWRENSEQVFAPDVVVELEVLKARARGPLKLPQPSDNITLFDLWAAATWKPLSFEYAPAPTTQIAVHHARRERFEALLRETYEEWEADEGHPSPFDTP